MSVHEWDWYRYVTCRLVDGDRYVGYVDALDWEHAQYLCDKRDLGEKVEGVLYAVVMVAGWCSEDANVFVRALANCDDGMGPPFASTFGDL